MRNLLQTPLAEEELGRLLSSIPHRPLLPPRGSPEWKQAGRKRSVQKWMAQILPRARAEAEQSLPVLTDELYAAFHRTGTRLNFERVYFERRRRLARAAMCALIDDVTPLWLDSVVRKLEDVFEEISWALPAHVQHPTVKDPARIDLFAAETANLMAEMITLFGAALPGEFVRRIRERLRKQFWENYLANIEAHTWTLVDNNWNAVCHQGVLGSALALEDDPAFLAGLLAQVARYLPRFLAGFTPDGGCSEGPMYWEYGFGWFAMLNEQLEQRTGGQLSLFANDERIHRIARYGPAMSLSNGHLVNFADCVPTRLLSPSLLRYLGERLNEESCRIQAGINFERLRVSGLDLDVNRADLFNLVRLFMSCPADLDKPVQATQTDVFLPHLGVLVCRSRNDRGHLWEFAAKAGHNGEHHNHNDCGSYLLHVDGQRMVMELGSPEYRRETFGSGRYELLATRSLGHSVPLINGCEQAVGKEFAARVLEHQTIASETRFRIDLTRCYPATAGCDRCVRTFVFDRGTSELRVEDEFRLTNPCDVESVVITEAKVSVSGGTATISRNDVHLRLLPGAESRIADVQTHIYHTLDGKEATVRRIVLKPLATTAETTINYCLRTVLA